MTRTLYEENQAFGAFAYLFGGGALVAAAIATFAALSASHQTPAHLRWLVLLLHATAFVFVMNILFLRTVVTEDALSLRLGYFFPLGWKKIPTHEIGHPRVVTYRPIRDAGGWGIRYGRFEGKPCRFWNARGNRGVYFEFRQHRYIVGSQKPQALLDVLQDLSRKNNKPAAS